MQCSALSTVIKKIMSFTVSIPFKLQKSYLYLLLPGQWQGKYAFLWEQFHNHHKNLPVFVNAPILFSPVGFPYRKTQNTINYTDVDTQKNSEQRWLQPLQQWRLLMILIISNILVTLGIFDHYSSLFVTIGNFCHFRLFWTLLSTLQPYLSLQDTVSHFGHLGQFSLR